MAREVRTQVGQSVSRVANELALGHFVLDGWTGQVDGEENEREAENVDGVLAQLQLRVARAEALGELLEQHGQVGVAFFGRLDLGEESAQGGWQELVLVVVQNDDVLEDRWLFFEELLFLFGVQLLGRVDEFGNLEWIVVHEILFDQVLHSLLPIGVERQGRLVQVHEYGAESLAQRVRRRRRLFARGVHDGLDALFVVNAGIAPRRATQRLPQDVVVRQARPHAGGQAQIGGVQVFEYLQRQLGRNLIEIRKLDAGFITSPTATAGGRRVGCCRAAPLIRALVSSRPRGVGGGRRFFGAVRDGGRAEFELFQLVKQQAHVGGGVGRIRKPNKNRSTSSTIPVLANGFT